MEHFGAFLLVLTCVLQLPLTEGFPTCSRERFSCNNSRCVPLNLRCDGVDDCGDSSDEVSCLNCTTGSFHCVATARCVPGHRICDGKADCSDGADEQLNACISLHKPQACSRSEFRCSNGHCVTSSWRCDHSNDCEDGSDEENCDQNECEVNNGGCSHMCIDLTLGFMCECPSGMRLLEDTHCEDVDQCLDLDLCDQTCDHSNGSPTCECQDGYVLTPGTGQCEATGDVAYMVVSTQEGLQWMDLGGSEQRNITSQTSSPGPVSALNANNTLYWASPENDIIYSLSLDSSGQSPTVLLKASTGILGLSVDWTHELLYWVSTSSHALHVASLNGSKQRQLILGLSRPTAVAVQPLLGHLFWADSGASPRIERASLDGEGRIALITSAIRHPVAISLDIPRGLLYWADSGLRTISRVAFNGQHRKTVVESNGYLDQPFGLVVFESRVYWSDQLTNSACSADKHNGRTLQVSQRLGSVSPAGLAILHPLLQPADKDLSKSETRGQLPISPFTWIFSLTVILCILLVGAVIWWQRVEFRGPHSFSLGGVSLKESQDPLLLAGLSAVHERKDGIQTSPTQ